MKTYLIPILLLLTTACTGMTQVRVCNTPEHCQRLQEERLDRIESKAEARGKEL